MDIANRKRPGGLFAELCAYRQTGVWINQFVSGPEEEEEDLVQAVSDVAPPSTICVGDGARYTGRSPAS